MVIESGFRWGAKYMGLNASWLAVQGGDRATVLEQLGLSEIGLTNDELESKYCCAELPTGWFLVFSNRGSLNPSRKAAALSRNGNVLVAEMVESVMYSRCSAWRNGQQIWDVEYNAEDDEADVSVSGEPPPEFAAIRARLSKEQDELDGVDLLLDIPIELSASVCGFADPLGKTRSGLTFSKLEPVRGGSPLGFLKGLFGRGS